MPINDDTKVRMPEEGTGDDDNDDTNVRMPEHGTGDDDL